MQSVFERGSFRSRYPHRKFSAVCADLVSQVTSIILDVAAAYLGDRLSIQTHHYLSHWLVSMLNIEVDLYNT